MEKAEMMLPKLCKEKTVKTDISEKIILVIHYIVAYWICLTVMYICLKIYLNFKLWFRDNDS